MTLFQLAIIAQKATSNLLAGNDNYLVGQHSSEDQRDSPVPGGTAESRGGIQQVDGLVRKMSRASVGMVRRLARLELSPGTPSCGLSRSTGYLDCLKVTRDLSGGPFSCQPSMIWPRNHQASFLMQSIGRNSHRARVSRV